MATARPKRTARQSRIFGKVVLWTLTLLFTANATSLVRGEKSSFRLIQEPEEVVLRLNAEGFNPAEVTRVPGRFQLSVDNRSGVEQLTLHFKGADGTLLREIRVLRGASDWSELFDLAPGDYTLSEANHANWVCSFTIRNL